MNNVKSPTNLQNRNRIFLSDVLGQTYFLVYTNIDMANSNQILGGMAQQKSVNDLHYHPKQDGRKYILDVKSLTRIQNWISDLMSVKILFIAVNLLTAIHLSATHIPSGIINRKTRAVDCLSKCYFSHAPQQTLFSSPAGQLGYIWSQDKCQ